MKSISCKQILSWGVSYDMLYEWNDRLRKIPLDKNLYRFSNEIIALFKPFNHSIDYSPFKFTIRLFPSLLRDESPLITFNVLISIYFIPTLKIKAPTKVMASLISYIKEILSIDDEYIYITRDDKYSAKNIKIAKNLSSITPDVVEKISSFISKVLEFYNTYVNQESNYLYREISNIKLDKNDLINQYLDDLEKANQEGDQDKINSIKRNIDDLNKFGSLRSLLSWGIPQEDQIKDMLLESIDWSKVANLIELYYQELLQVDRHASYYDAIDLFLDYNLSSEDPTISYRHLQESYPEIDPVLWNKVFSGLLFQSIHLSSQKLSWGEEDFIEEERDKYGNIIRRNSEGKYHSLFSPAIEFNSGSKYWFQNSKLHRLDGPAEENSNGFKEWWFENEFYGDSNSGYTQEQFEKDLRREGKIASMKLGWYYEEDFVEEYKNEFGSIVRKNDKGQFHSLYSPAIEYTNGSKAWYQNDELHRLDGPAVEYYDNYKAWYQNNKLHRLDGPAKEHPDGYKEWYYDDNWYGDANEGYTQEKFEEDLKKDGKIASMKQGSDELFICLWAPDDVYTKFPNVDDELHVTLIYRKDITSSPDLSESFLKSIGNICDEVGTVKCKATGIGTFNNDSKSDAVLINIVKGASLYEKLRSLVESIYGKWDIDYGYLPHMTLKYKGTGKVSLKKFKPFTWNVRHIGVRIGEDNYLVNMKTGEYKKTKKILSSLEDSSNTLESILPEDSNSFVNPKEDRDIRRVNNKRYDKITDIYDTSNSEISNRTDNPIIGIASQKLSWGEEDFIEEERDKYGNIIRRNSEGKYHSLFSPAIEFNSGSKYWFQNSKLHRLDGPAEENSNGFKEWWFENEFYGDSNSGYTQEQFEKDLRNEGKIASKKLSWGEDDFVKEYTDDYGDIFRIDAHGNYHSLYSPAVEWKNGTKEWFQKGKRHRLDGPAFTKQDGRSRWYYKGSLYGMSDKGYSQEKFEQDLRRNDVIASQKLSWGDEDFVNEYTDENGDLHRYNSKGQLHSLYSPAIEWENGNKYWYQNGKRHRLDGPAYEGQDGYKYWYYEDQIYGSSTSGYTQEKFEQDLRNKGKIASKKLAWGEEEDFVKEHRNENGSIFRVFRENDKGEYHSLYSPAIEFSDGSKFWYQNGKRHREDGPAIENSSGDKYWYQNGKRHRLDGPAVEYYDGSKSWYYEGERYGNSRNSYTQEKFEEDLRKDDKIASMKLSWGDFHTYVFTEPISKSVMSPSLDNSKEAQEELLKSKLEKTIRNNELGIKVNKVTFISEDRSDGGERFMSYRYYRYDISCSTQDLVKLAKAVRLYTELLPTFNVYTTNITEDGLPFDLEAAFDKYW